jgi:hypothetical protein
VGYGIGGKTDNTITLIGEPEYTVDAGEAEAADPEYEHHRLPYRLKRSTAVLRTILDIDHRPGHYELLYVACRTVMGMFMGADADHLDEDARSASFRILPVPEDPSVFDPEVSIELIDEDAEP